MRIPLPRGAWRLTIFAAPALVACAGKDPTQPPSPSTPSVRVQLGDGALSLSRGQRGIVPLTIARGGGYTGAVTVTVPGAPSGLTATFAPASLPSDASTGAVNLVVEAAPSLAAGTYYLTIVPSGAGAVGRSATLFLIVTKAFPE